jgi:predicted MFS family arabinose efflux permease
MTTTARLSLMMFLEYVTWGSWLPLLALYLGNVLKFTASEIGWIFATPAVAAVAGLFVGGQIADRLMSPEKLLAVLHLGAAAAMFAMTLQTSFWPFLALMLVR